MNGFVVQTFHAVSLSCDINTGKNQSDCTNYLKCVGAKVTDDVKPSALRDCGIGLQVLIQREWNRKAIH